MKHMDFYRRHYHKRRFLPACESTFALLSLALFSLWYRPHHPNRQCDLPESCSLSYTRVSDVPEVCQKSVGHIV